MRDPPSGPDGDHLDDVETAGSFSPPGPREKHGGHAGDPSSLDRRDRLRRSPEGALGAGLDLDEDDNGAVPGNEVDFAAPDSKPARDDDEPRPAQPALRRSLSGIP